LGAGASRNATAKSNPKGPQGHPDAERMGVSPSLCGMGRQLPIPGDAQPTLSGLAAHPAQAGEVAASPRSEAPARAGAGGGKDDLGRGHKTQGRSESRPSRKARRGFGTRRRSKASRPSESRRTSRERRLATVSGAGEVENAPPPGRSCRASGREARGFAGDRFRAALGPQGSRAQPLRRQEHPRRFTGPSYRRASVEVGGRWWLWRTGQPAGASPFETRCGRCPASAGDGAFGVKPRSTSRASGGPRRTRGPRGDEARASGLDPWHGVRRTCADPARLHGEATARGQERRGDAVPAAGEDRLRRESALRERSRITRTAHRAIGVQRGRVELETQ
jgi:hypothetical protein